MFASFSARQLPLGVAVALALAGCVLQSPKEIFPETKGVAALASLGTRFTSESLDRSGKWIREEGEISFAAEGHHYVAKNSKEKDEIDVLFAAIGGNRFVMQAREEEGKPFAYMIAEVADGRLLVSPLLCDQLKTDAQVAAAITFEGSDCTVTGKWDEAAFAASVPLLGPAKLRLTPVAP